MVCLVSLFLLSLLFLWQRAILPQSCKLAINCCPSAVFVPHAAPTARLQHEEPDWGPAKMLAPSLPWPLSGAMSQKAAGL